jgi:ATP-dependent RNA helicase RhlB
MSTDRLAIRLRRQGFSCELLSGDVQQTRRMRVLEDFRSGAVKIVVATDVAGRGLHITDIGLVVNFELPYEAEDYVHRIGRTGRAGKVGTAVSFACEDESFQIPEIEKFLGETLKCTLPDDALLAPLPPPAPLPPRREGERGAAGAYGRPDGRHGGQGRDRPRGGRDGDRGEPRHSAQPPRHEAPRHSEPPRNEPPPQGGAAPVEAVTPSPAPQPSPPEPRATEPRATEPRATEPRAMEPRPAPPPRPAAHHRPPAETPGAHARAIPPPSAATHPGHARVQVWEPGGNKA